MWTILTILFAVLVYVAYVKWGRFFDLFKRGGWVILGLYAVLAIWYFNHF